MKSVSGARCRVQMLLLIQLLLLSVWAFPLLNAEVVEDEKNPLENYPSAESNSRSKRLRGVPSSSTARANIETEEIDRETLVAEEIFVLNEKTTTNYRWFGLEPEQLRLKDKEETGPGPEDEDDVARWLAGELPSESIDKDADQDHHRELQYGYLMTNRFGTTNRRRRFPNALNQQQNLQQRNGNVFYRNPNVFYSYPYNQPTAGSMFQQQQRVGPVNNNGQQTSSRYYQTPRNPYTANSIYTTARYTNPIIIGESTRTETTAEATAAETTPRPTSPRNPTSNPTREPTKSPVVGETPSPTKSPSKAPSGQPSLRPTFKPTLQPSSAPTKGPTKAPKTPKPTATPSQAPTKGPTKAPKTPKPTTAPSQAPTKNPTKNPTRSPTKD